MQCISCGSEVSSKMKSALHSNTCPFCGSSILESSRARSYADLITVFDKVRLTNRDDVDLQIKEKMIDILIRNFDLSKIESQSQDDVITVDDVVSPVKTPSLDDAPVRAVKAPPRQIKSQNVSPAARMYAEAAEATYGDDSLEDTLVEDSDFSPEELEKFFPQSVDLELSSKVDKYKKLHKERFSKSDSSKGIKRL